MLITTEACAQYARVANLSAIGTNSTIRSAFLEASPVGAMSNSATLNVAQAAVKTLMMDVARNTACGNLSAMALQKVGVNFSMGIVGYIQRKPGLGRQWPDYHRYDCCVPVSTPWAGFGGVTWWKVEIWGRSAAVGITRAGMRGGQECGGQLR